MSRTQEADFLFADKQTGCRGREGGGYKMWNTPCQSNQLLIDVSVERVERINACDSTSRTYGQLLGG